MSNRIYNPPAPRATRQRPFGLLVVADRSASTSDDGARRSDGRLPAEEIADSINEHIIALGMAAHKEKADGSGFDLRDYYHLGFAGYAVGVETIVPPLGTDRLHPISRVYTSERGWREMPRMLLGEPVAGETARVPYWVDAEARGGSTNAAAAMEHARDLVSASLSGAQAYTALTVLHLTDGQYNLGGDPSTHMQAIRALDSAATPVVLMNVYVNPQREAEEIAFPAEFTGSAYGRLLFEQSSVLPPWMRSELERELNRPLEPGARAFVMNASSTAISMALRCGTPLSINAPG